MLTYIFTKAEITGYEFHTILYDKQK